MANGDITYSRKGGESLVKSFASGSYVGLATATIDIIVGFTPSKIVMHNDTDDTEYTWFTGVAQGSMFQRIAAGDKTLEVLGSAGVEAPLPLTAAMKDAAGALVDGEGIRVPLGTTTALNTTADVVYWEFWR
jgi:hypothetical protein